MSALNDHGLFRELLVLWPAWQTIVEFVSRTDPRDADPQSIYGSACATDLGRVTALLYAYQHGDTLEDAAAILGEVLAMAAAGRRPRYGRELGLTAAMFGMGGEAA
jgi:hypothetical protein